MIIWGVFAQGYFGHLLPMSMLVKMTSPKTLSAYHSVKPALKYFWESAQFSLSSSSRFLLLQVKARETFRSGFQIIVMALALGLSLLGLLKCLFSRQPSRAVVALLLFDAAGVLCNILFGAAQAGHSEDMYYSVWYVYDLPRPGRDQLRFRDRVGAVGIDRSPASGGPATAVLALASVAYFVDDVAWYQRLKPYDAADDAGCSQGSWQVKKFEAASWFRDNVAPANPNYRVVAYSAGALSFYLFDHVINVDGLANNAAGEAILSSDSSAGYAKSIKPDYLIEICKAENDFGNLERLHVVPFAKQGNYSIDRFVYKAGTSQ